MYILVMGPLLLKSMTYIFSYIVQHLAVSSKVWVCWVSCTFECRNSQTCPPVEAISQIGSSSWLISHAVFNCADLRQRIKQCPVMVIVRDNTLNFYAVSSGLSYCTAFISVWAKRQQILIFFDNDYQSVSSTWNLLDLMVCCQVPTKLVKTSAPKSKQMILYYIVSWSISLSAIYIPQHYIVLGLWLTQGGR